VGVCEFKLIYYVGEIGIVFFILIVFIIIVFTDGLVNYPLFLYSLPLFITIGIRAFPLKFSITATLPSTSSILYHQNNLNER